MEDRCSAFAEILQGAGHERLAEPKTSGAKAVNIGCDGGNFSALLGRCKNPEDTVYAQTKAQSARAPVGFVHQQQIGLEVAGQLKGFGFARVEIGGAQIRGNGLD